MFINRLYILCYPLIDALHKYLEHHKEKKEYNKCFRVRIRIKENTGFKCSGAPEYSGSQKDLMIDIRGCRNCPYFSRSR